MLEAKVILVIALGFAFIGVVFVGISIAVSRSVAYKKEVYTRQVVAQVVDIKQMKMHSLGIHQYGDSWFPVYEYWVDGRKIQQRSSVGGLSKDFQIGQKVTLQINPQNVKKFYNPNSQMGRLKTIFLVVGAALLTCGVGVLFFGKLFISHLL